MWPAYGAYAQTLRDYRARARETIGLTDLPDGDARYASAIEGWTTMPMSADEVHRIGLEEMESIQEERRDAARRLGFASADEALAAHAETGRDTPSSRRRSSAWPSTRSGRGGRRRRPHSGGCPAPSARSGP